MSIPSKSVCLCIKRKSQNKLIENSANLTSRSVETTTDYLLKIQTKQKISICSNLKYFHRNHTICVNDNDCIDLLPLNPSQRCKGLTKTLCVFSLPHPLLLFFSDTLPNPIQNWCCGLEMWVCELFPFVQLHCNTKDLERV